MTDDTATAVLDRFESDRAVLVVERDAAEEVVLDRGDLPADGRHEDAVFRITFDGDSVKSVRYVPDRTAERRERARRRFDRLSERPPSDAGTGPDPDGGGDSDGDGDGDAG